MPHRLFAYGTLMFPRVFQHVTGRSAHGQPAELTGYGRYCLRGRSYPGIGPRTGEQVQGMLYEGITAKQLRQLDTFEGRIYRRERIRARNARGRTVSAWAYVVRPRYRALLARQAWNPEWFGRQGVEYFLSREG